LAFLAHVDGRLESKLAHTLGIEMQGPFRPIVFLHDDDGTFLSLFYAIEVNYDGIFKYEPPRVAFHSRLTQKQQDKLGKLKVKALKTAVVRELSRRGVRAALGYEVEGGDPRARAKAISWILNGENPLPGSMPDLSQGGPPWKFGFYVGGPELTRICEHLRTYIEPQQEDLTNPGHLNDSSGVNRRIEKTQREARQEQLAEATMPANHRPRVAASEGSYEIPTIEILHERMKQAQEKANFTYDQIAERGGFGKNSTNRKAAIYELLRHSTNPPLYSILKFCHAVGITPGELLDPPRKKE
jgi:hypothetical protein